MNENEIARRILALLKANPQVKLDNLSSAELRQLDSTRITQFRHYREDEQIAILKLLVPALIESCEILVPTLIESCEIFVPALIFKSQMLFADIGALTYKVIRYEGAHPEELCPCDARWVPAAEGCILACDGNGEFSSQEECENFRNGGSGGLPGTLRISARVTWSQVSPDPTNPTHFPGGFPDGWTPGIYASTPYRNAYIVVPKNGGNPPVEYSASLRKWKLVSGASWPSQPQFFLDIDDCYIYQAGLLKQWNQGINIEPSLDQDIGWPAHGTFNKTAWPGQTPPLGTVFTEGFIYSGGQTQVTFDRWGIVDSWSTREIAGPPATPIPPNSINDDLEDDQGYHYQVHFYLSCLTQQSISLGNYLIKADRSKYDPSVGGATDNYLDFGEGPYGTSYDDKLVDAFMCCVGEKKFEVVVKYGKFRKRIVVGGEQKFNYYWCAIDRYLIDGSNVSKTTYKYPQYVELHPDNWMAFLMRNWNYNFYAPQGSPNQGLTVSSDKLLSIFYAPATTYTNPVYNPEISDRAIAEYLHGWALATGHTVNGISIDRLPLKDSGTKIQGARIGSDGYLPEYAATMGCNFIKDAETNKWYVIDVALNQWISGAPPPEADTTLTGNILIEALRSQDCENIQLKVGEAEVTYLAKETTTSRSRPLNSLRDASIRIKNMKAAGGKKAFKIDIEGAGVLEVQTWLSAENIKSTNASFTKFPLYKCFMRQSDEYDIFLGDFTFAHQQPLADFSFLEEDSYPVYPRLDYFYFFYNPYSYHSELRILTFKDCTGNILRQLDGPQTIYTGSYPSALVYQMNWRPLIIGGC